MPPQIRLEKPSLKSVLNGSTVTVSCFVETDLNPVVSWYVNETKNTLGFTTETQQGTKVCNLTINATEWKNLRTVECKAEHSCFSNATKKMINFTGKLYISFDNEVYK